LINERLTNVRLVEDKSNVEQFEMITDNIQSKRKNNRFKNTQVESSIRFKNEVNVQTTNSMKTLNCKINRDGRRDLKKSGNI